MFKKLRAIWLLYKCRSFHLVTIEEPDVLQVQACQLSTMSEGEFGAVMKAQLDEAMNSPEVKDKLEQLTTNR